MYVNEPCWCRLKVRRLVIIHIKNILLICRHYERGLQGFWKRRVLELPATRSSFLSFRVIPYQVEVSTFSFSFLFHYCFPSLISVLLSLFLVLKLLLMITFCLQDHPMIRSLNSASFTFPCQWYTRSTASPGTVSGTELRRMLHALHRAGGRNRHGLSSRV